MYFMGEGVKQSNSYAYMWAILVAPKEDEDARLWHSPGTVAYFRDTVARLMTPVQLEKAQVP